MGERKHKQLDRRSLELNCCARTLERDGYVQASFDSLSIFLAIIFD